jgi:hypothetical protein
VTHWTRCEIQHSSGLQEIRPGAYLPGGSAQHPPNRRSI